MNCVVCEPQMKQTFFSWFSPPSTICAAATLGSSGEYCLQLLVEDVGDEADEDDDDGDDIVIFGAILNYVTFEISWSN